MRRSDRPAVPTEWTLPLLLARAGLSAEGHDVLPDVKITSLADDSRKVSRGSCFVAVRGAQHDGHRFVGAAVNAGAAAIVVDRDVDVPGDAVRVRVADTREALGALAAAYFGLRDRRQGQDVAGSVTPRGLKPAAREKEPAAREKEGAARGRGRVAHDRTNDEGVRNPRMIAVTGTNGKTTVAWLLRSILQAAGHRAMLIGTIEYDLLTAVKPAPLTTPMPIDLCRHLAAARDAGADFAVLEVSSYALDQRRTDGLAFSAGVFTNLSGDHLDYHGSMEAYRRAKRRLFDSLGEGAAAVVNCDDPAASSMVENTAARVVTFGIDTSNVDVRARIETVDFAGSRFVIEGRSFETAVHLCLLGRHNVINALAAAAVAEALGVGDAAIRAGLQRITGVPGRLQRVDPQGSQFCVLVDYAHTDEALRHVLLAIRPLTRGRLICVFGCGGDRDRSKRPRMATAVESLADMAYVTSDNPRTEDPQAIIDEILPGFGASPKCCVEVELDRKRAIEAAIAAAQPGDTVLIAGKGHENYQLVGDTVLHFDDVEVAEGCLERLAVGEGVG